MSPRQEPSGGPPLGRRPGGSAGPGHGSGSGHGPDEPEIAGQLDDGPRPGAAHGETDATEVAGDVLGALEASTRERDEYLEMLRRVQADFENYKKRMMRQQTELLERAAEGLVLRLLPAVDAFDLARAHLGEAEDLSPEGKALVQASALLFDSLSKEGLERVDDDGAPFDPTVHEAVEHETATPAAGKDAARAEDPDPLGKEAKDGIDTGAVAVTEQDGPVVSAVLRPGYRWKGRVIRPAMVRVRG